MRQEGIYTYYVTPSSDAVVRRWSHWFRRLKAIPVTECLRRAMKKTSVEVSEDRLDEGVLMEHGGRAGFT